MTRASRKGDLCPGFVRDSCDFFWLHGHCQCLQTSGKFPPREETLNRFILLGCIVGVKMH